MHIRAAFVAVAIAAVWIAASVQGDDAYKFVTAIPIEGEGGWDILTVDSDARRLYLSHATKVVVIDLETNAVAGEIGDTPGVHEFLAIPELKRGFSSNGKENKSSVVDLTNQKTIAKIETGENPDAMAYDAAKHELYVFNHSGKTATVINTKGQNAVATIPLDGEPEFGVADPTAARVYVNIEDKSEVEVIDTGQHEVVARWPLAPGTEPTGIALDPAHHRLFSTCHNQLMTVLDTTTGKLVATVPIAKGVDGCAFDDASQLAFASCGEGVAVISHEDSPDKFSIVQNLKTERGARTIALDPKTHRIYLPTAQFEPAGSPPPGQSPARPKIVPNTFKVLVYERAR